jgi:hypothetical protein
MNVRINDLQGQNLRQRSGPSVTLTINPYLQAICAIANAKTQGLASSPQLPEEQEILRTVAHEAAYRRGTK